MTESIFENRFKYLDELARMGANVKVEGNSATIEGVEKLSGARVSAPDLRAEQHFALQVLQLTESRLLTTLCISREDMSVSRRKSVESAESLNVCLQSVRFRSSS